MKRFRNRLLISLLKALAFTNPVFFILGFGLIAWTGYHAYTIQKQLAGNDQRLQDTQARITHIQDAQTTLYGMESALRRSALTGHADLSLKARQTGDLYTALNNLRHLSENTPQQQQLGDSLKALVNRYTELYDRGLSDNNAGPSVVDAISSMLTGRLHQERAQLAVFQARHSAYLQNILTSSLLGSGVALLILLINLFSWYRNARLRKVLSGSEQTYRSLVEDAQMIMFIVDSGGYFTYVNKEMVAFSGYSAEELMNTHGSIFLDDETLEQISNTVIERQGYGNLPRKIPQITLEFQALRKNGEKRWVIMYLSLYWYNNRVNGYQCVLKDIDDQKKLELEMKRLEARQQETQHQLQAILDHSASIIFIKDLQGRYLLANKQFSTMFRLEEAQVTGRTDEDLADKENAGIWRRNDRKAIEENRAVQTVETVKPDDTEHHLFMTRFPLLDHKGQLFGVCGIGIDITERVNYERELIEARTVAEQAKRSQEVFLANMSHEIRTPINGITGMSYLLDKTPLNTEQREYLDGIKDASRSLLVIINDILDFSKIHAGKLTLEKVPLNIQHVISRVIIRLKSQADKKGLPIYQETGSDIPLNLTGDPVRISQVLGNLIENAVKFTERGHVTVQAKLLSEDASSVLIGFEVQDTGIGIPADKQELIFKSFTQSSAENSRKYGGTGLGLAISKELVTMQGGSISVSSTSGKGAVFSFEIPFTRSNMQPVDAATAPVLPQQALEGKYILLTEDNPLNQKVARYILQQAGASVDVAAGGKSALQLILANRYDCVLMDIQMPGIDGYQATALIRQTGINIPVIAMTASAIAGEKEKCIQAGMNDYISKPFIPEELFLKILHATGEAAYITIPVNRSAPAATEQFIDLSYFRSMLKEDTAQMRELLLEFTDMLSATTSGLQEAAAGGQWDTVYQLTHRLRSSLGIIRINPAIRLATSLEEDARLQQQVHTIPDRIQQLTDILNKAGAALRQESADILL